MESYEKKYKEALELARDYYKANLTLNKVDENAVLEDIFPELKESEDERIRKALITYFQRFPYPYGGIESAGTNAKDAIVWLEKQKSVEEIVARCKDSWYNEGKIAGMAEGLSDDEKYQQGWHDAIEKQVPVDKDKVVKGVRRGIATFLINYIDANSKGMCLSNMECEDIEDAIVNNKWYKVYGYMKKKLEKQGEKPQDKTEEKTDNANKVEQKFKAGDWVILTAGELSITLQIVSVDTNKKLYCFNDSTYLPIVDEECLHLWTIEDAKEGDVLYSLDSKQPFIFKHRKTHEQAEVYCGINIYGKFFVGNTKDCIITTDKYIPATKEQRDKLLKAMADAGYRDTKYIATSEGNIFNEKTGKYLKPQSNQRHAVETNLKQHGTDLWNGKFTKEQVLSIIKDKQEGYSCRELGRKYGVDPTTISAISRGLRYRQYFTKDELQHALSCVELKKK